MTDIEKFLRGMVAVKDTMGIRPLNGYLGLEDFVLKEGVYMAGPSTPLPEGVRPGRAKQCYMNAYYVATSRPQFLYCEGYASTTDMRLPVPHAWNLDAYTGAVVDTTWRERGGEYFGVIVTVMALLNFIRELETYGLLDQPGHSWPMLRAQPSHWKHPITERMKLVAAKCSPDTVPVTDNKNKNKRKVTAHEKGHQG